MTSLEGPARRAVRLCLTGDVMLGRGVDQIQRHPGDPTIHESWARSALRYVELAERASGRIPRGVEPGYVWGEVLADLRAAPPDAFVVNLETAVTDRGQPWPGKAIQYRMHPSNTECLSVAGIDVVGLANNHAIDWSIAGLEHTLDVLDGAGLRTAGAGRSESESWTPAVVAVPSGHRVVVIAAGSTSSGIPPEWAAGERRAGVAVLPGLSDLAVDLVARISRSAAGPDDIVVASLHWGGNWGHAIPRSHRLFAHRLIDEAGVHVVHGHSSHHPLGIEVYRERLILYGCGDLITDYEGIEGHEEYRGDLGALYHPEIEAGSGRLRSLELVPTRVRRFCLTRPPEDDMSWLTAVLDREGARLGTGATLSGAGRIVIDW